MLTWLFGLAFLAMAILPGCHIVKNKSQVVDESDLLHYKYASTRIEYPDVEISSDFQSAVTLSPITLDSNTPPEYWDLKLEETIRMGLANSKILRDLGGLILTSPENVTSVYDPSIQESDPRFGVQAALSAFDASFAHSTSVEKNDRLLNNTFFGGGTRSLSQDAVVLQSQISKLAVTGTEMTLRNITNYDDNNSPGNQFGTVWENFVEAEFRHPLLLGGGVEFNRIAGPSQTPGLYGGVLVARMNNDISLSEFEVAVRDYVSNVENAYWDLFFAYRDLEAKKAARDSALETWRRIHALYVTGRRGGEAEKEAQAREQYFRFQEEMENALNGIPGGGTNSFNGTGGGIFRGTGGVYTAERRVRLVIGLPVTDGRLIRPADEPMLAKVTFNWDDILVEGLTRRPELRKQRWLVQRYEKELVASRKFLLPTLDLVGLYRWRGFGRDLFPNGNGPIGFNDNALTNLARGKYTEWQAGVELSFPFGQRRAHAGVRNAELILSRERAIMKEQERSLVNAISEAIAEVDRSYRVMHTNFNRRLAAKQQVAAVQAAYEAETASVDLLLDAQRRLAEAESGFFGSWTAYALSIKNVHFEKGSLLDYNEVYLSEGMWPVKAYYQAAERHRLRSRPLKIKRFMETGPDVSQGAFPQMIIPEGDFWDASQKLNDTPSGNDGASEFNDGTLPPSPLGPIDETDQGDAGLNSSNFSPGNEGNSVLPSELLESVRPSKSTLAESR